jgi:regulator of replication initiation timing
MSSRIEIPMTEYNGLKNKIKQLESTLVDVSKEASTYKEKLSILEGLVMDLENEKLVDRLFTWKSIVKPFKDVFKKNDKTE